MGCTESKVANDSEVDSSSQRSSYGGNHNTVFRLLTGLGMGGGLKQKVGAKESGEGEDDEANKQGLIKTGLSSQKDGLTDSAVKVMIVVSRAMLASSISSTSFFSHCHLCVMLQVRPLLEFEIQNGSSDVVKVLYPSRVREIVSSVLLGSKFT
jgi:hypothetical protein